MFQNWSDEPYINNEDGIMTTIDIHKKLTEDIPVSCEPEDYRYLRVSYKLKKGKTLERVYKVSEET